jgi:hypothetical protein
VLAYICYVSQPIVFYTTSTTNRLQYIVSFLFETVLQQEVVIVNNLNLIDIENSCIINYTHQDISGTFQVAPHSILFETNIETQSIHIVLKNETPIFFENNSAFGFDIFAASFYLLSRYEEYLPHTKDAYNRYAHTNSVAFKNGFLHLPLINIWVTIFWHQLQLYNKTLPLYTPNGAELFTYDVDMAYAFKHKGIVRQAKAIFQNVMCFDFKTLLKRYAVITNAVPDPFDNFDHILLLHAPYTSKPFFFILCAKYLHKFNKNNNRNAQEFIQLIGNLKSKANIGIHPSYTSSVNTAILPEEKQWLQSQLQTTVTASRQHYIKFQMPETFEQLISNGITSDYSMGYGSINGFRASTSCAHLFFNIKQNKCTTLTMHPFCWMDANALYEQKLTSKEALEEYLHYKKIVQQYGGTCISIWHNFIISDVPEFKNYCKVHIGALH